MNIQNLRILATKQTGCACAPPVAFSMSVLKIRLVQALGGTQVSSKPGNCSCSTGKSSTKGPKRRPFWAKLCHADQGTPASWLLKERCHQSRLLHERPRRFCWKWSNDLWKWLRMSEISWSYICPHFVSSVLDQIYPVIFCPIIKPFTASPVEKDTFPSLEENDAGL